MMKQNNKIIVAIFAVMAMLVFSSMVGCSKAPTVNEENDSATLLTRANLPVGKLVGEAAYFDTVLTAEEGGIVSLLDVELYFPPFALASDTLISIEIPDISVFANEFGTDGLYFKKPVRVTMSYRDADLSNVREENIKMAWFNERTEQWDVIDCLLDAENKTVTGYVYHFSAYALISD